MSGSGGSGIKRIDTNKTSQSELELSMQSDDKTIVESTHSVDWGVDIKRQSPVPSPRPEAEAEPEGGISGSDIDTYTEPSNLEQSQPINDLPAPPAEPETNDAKANQIVEELLKEMIKVDDKSGKLRIFPHRHVMLNAFQDKFPNKPIDYESYKDKKGIDTSVTDVKSFLDTLVSSLKSGVSLRQLKQNIYKMQKVDIDSELTKITKLPSKEDKLQSIPEPGDDEIISESILQSITTKMTNSKMTDT